MLKLQLRKQPNEFVKLASSSLTIGRDENNTFVIDAPSVSDFHAEISYEDKQHFITDLLSGAGTFVNGNRIANRTSIKAWDAIRLGNVELEVVDSSQHHPDEWALKGSSAEVANQYFPLTQALSVLGRDAACDIRIDNAMLSRRHAEVHLDDNQLRLVDLDSSNGTFVNGARISDSVLVPGDEVRFDKLGYTVAGPKIVTAGPDADDDRTLVRTADSEQTVIGVRVPETVPEKVPGTAPAATPDEKIDANPPQAAVSASAVDGVASAAPELGGAASNPAPAEPAVAPLPEVNQVQEAQVPQAAPEEASPGEPVAAASGTEDIASVRASEKITPPEEATRLFFTAVAPARLIAVAGEQINYELQLPEINIGRSASNTVTLGDTSVSKKHAVLSFKAGQWRIKDNNSRNGTLHNGKIIEAPAALRHGDVIKLGRLEYRFELDAPSAGAAPLSHPVADPQATAIYAGPLVTRSKGDDRPAAQSPMQQQLWHNRYVLAAVAIVAVVVAAVLLSQR